MPVSDKTKYRDESETRRDGLIDVRIRFLTDKYLNL